MAIFDLFSKRQKRLRGGVPDVFKYDDIPEGLRVQIIHIWNDVFGEYSSYESWAPKAYEKIYNILRREYGVFILTDGERKSHNYAQRLSYFLLECDEHEEVLDVIQLSFQVIDTFVRNTGYQTYSRPTMNPDNAIKELNKRFLEHGVGYEYKSAQLIRVDSQLLHAEVVKPTLGFLSAQEFAGVNQEFLKAHEHYRHGRYKECLNECLKAFESTMKAICQKQGWQYNKNDTAKRLIDICFKNKLIPDFLQSQFSALRALLESGIPTVRSKLGAHGQGAQKVIVPKYFAGYILHLTATTILFLIEAHKEII